MDDGGDNQHATQQMQRAPTISSAEQRALLSDRRPVRPTLRVLPRPDDLARLQTRMRAAVRAALERNRAEYASAMMAAGTDAGSP
jgi:hypothetical protein